MARRWIDRRFSPRQTEITDLSATGAVRARRTVAALLALFVSLFVAAPVVSAQPSNPGVIPPSASVSQTGKTYGEWSAAHWQYVFSIPKPTNPLLDETGAKCGLKQSGSVFFLVGTFASTVAPSGDVIGTATRTDCRVPEGKVLFFPILNAECSTAEGNGTTEAELRACATALINGVTNLAAEVDGVPIAGLQDVMTTQFRAQSPPFTFRLSGNNILGLAPQRSLSVADGVYLMLAPLTVGEHTIHIHGEVPLSPPAPSPRFVLDVTYSPLVVGHRNR
jgi:hypothetical protein